jgi:molecular chaperone GrpE
VKSQLWRERNAMPEKTTEIRERPFDDQTSGVAGASNAEQLQAELHETKQRLMLTAAELDNYRKRVRRELDEQRRYAAMPVMRDLLPVVDNLRRAVDSAERSADFDSLAQGVRLVLTQFEQVLSEHGITKIDGVGEPFDPRIHEATGGQPSDEHPAGTVAQVLQTGYRLHDRVVRPAKVVVSTGRALETPHHAGSDNDEPLDE